MSQRLDLEGSHPCQDCFVSAEAVCCVLGNDVLHELRDRSRTIHLKPGQPLFHQGDAASWAFSLTQGALKLYSVLPDGRRQIIAFHFPGEFVGFGEQRAYHCTAEALSEATLCKFDIRRFEQSELDWPELARSHQIRATKDLVTTQARVVMLGRATARERLASFFLDVFERYRPVVPGVTTLVYLPMDRCDIADYLGLAKETVSREFSAMRKLGIIRSRSRRLIEIVDMVHLKRLAITS